MAQDSTTLGIAQSCSVHSKSPSLSTGRSLHCCPLVEGSFDGPLEQLDDLIYFFRILEHGSMLVDSPLATDECSSFSSEFPPSPAPIKGTFLKEAHP